MSEKKTYTITASALLYFEVEAESDEAAHSKAAEFVANFTEQGYPAKVTNLPDDPTEVRNARLWSAGEESD